MMDFGIFFSTIFSLAAVVLVILLAYWTSRYISKRYSSLAMGKYMRIVDRIVIGQGQYLLLVEAAGIALLLGVSGPKIEKLCQLEKTELEEIIKRKGGCSS